MLQNTLKWKIGVDQKRCKWTKQKKIFHQGKSSTKSGYWHCHLSLDTECCWSLGFQQNIFLLYLMQGQIWCLVSVGHELQSPGQPRDLHASPEEMCTCESHGSDLWLSESSDTGYMLCYLVYVTMQKCWAMKRCCAMKWGQWMLDNEMGMCSLYSPTHSSPPFYSEGTGLYHLLSVIPHRPVLTRWCDIMFSKSVALNCFEPCQHTCGVLKSPRALAHA